MAVSIRRSICALAIAPVLLCMTVASANGQDTRKLRPEEQAFLDRMASEFAKILPPVPAGWAEVERRIHDAYGMTDDWDGPIGANYQWVIVSADIEARQKAVETREQEMADKTRAAFEAATARNEKLIEEYSAKIMAAAGRNDAAGEARLRAELDKKMAAGLPAPSGPAPEMSDTDARIRLSINPLGAPVEVERRQQASPGFILVGRREPQANSSAREGVTRYLIGNWEADTIGSGYTLKYTPNKRAQVYGIVLEIEARADRADALFRAMNVARLRALLP